MNKLRTLLVLGALALGFTASAQVPQLLNYQGRVAVGTTNFDGSGAFKFALVNTNGTTTYWSNDGTSAAGTEPTAAVTLTVTKGLYSVLLGDTAAPLSMTAIPASVWTNADVRLRVWFNDGTNGSQLLSPDQRLAPNGYLPDGSVSSAAIASGAITSAKIATGAVTNTQLAAGAVQTANIAASAVANAQLANSAITVTAGAGLGGGGPVSLGGSVSLTNAGVLSLTGGGGISVNTGTGAITLGSNATSANTASAIVLRDASGSFSAGTITLNGGFSLPATTSATEGVITQSGTALLHTFGTNTLFVGAGAGNFSMTGAFNTGTGVNALQSNTTGYANTASGGQALNANTIGSYNVASGVNALTLNTEGNANTATGAFALLHNTTGNASTASGASVLQDNTTGSNNTGNGASALQSNTTGGSNTATGVNALIANTTGSNNIALGNGAGASLTTGDNNIDIGNAGVAGETGIIRIGSTQTDTFLTGIIHGNGSGLTGIAVLSLPATSNSTVGTINQNGVSLMHTFGTNNFFAGSGAGNFGMTGTYNTGSGVNSLRSNTTGYANTASGGQALNANTTGSYNVANGANALTGNTEGNANTATGAFALLHNTTGNASTASGASVLQDNTTGSNNTGNGASALQSNTTGGSNTATGVNALIANTTGSNNIALGNGAGASLTTGDNNIDIGNAGVVAEANIIRIGTAGTQTDTYLTGVIHGNGSALTGLTVAAGSVTGTITGAQIATGAVGSSQLASGLTLGGTTIGTFSGNLAGNATTATSATTATTAGSFTGALVGDVTGTQGATVVSTVGTSTAGNVHAAELLANAATSVNTAGTIVKRDGSGNFSAGTVTLGSNGLAVGANQLVVNGGNIGIGTVSPDTKLTVGVPPTVGVDAVSQAAFYGSVDGAVVKVSRGGVSNPRELFLGVNQASGFTYIESINGGIGSGPLVLNPTAGNVGIGTTSPGSLLEIKGAANTTVTGIGLTKPSGGGAFNWTINNGIGGLDNGALSFAAGGSAKLTILGSGNVGIGTTSPATALDVNGTVTATAFNPPSDRNLKENFIKVSPREVLDKVAGLAITRWNFKGDAATPHVGPMAQDFHAAFGLGTDERHIATVDADGVALAAIQGLNQKVEEQRAENAELKKRLAEFEAKDKEREARVARLENRLPPAPVQTAENTKGN